MRSRGERQLDDADALIAQTRETIGGLRVVLANLRQHIEELEGELNTSQERDRHVGN